MCIILYIGTYRKKSRKRRVRNIVFCKGTRLTISAHKVSIGIRAHSTIYNIYMRVIKNSITTV